MTSHIPSWFECEIKRIRKITRKSALMRLIPSTDSVILLEKASLARAIWKGFAVENP